jgi:hypothetical protein
MSDPSRSNDPKPIGEAGSLFDTDEIRPIYRPEPLASTSAGPPATDGYELEGGPIPDDEELPLPVPIPIPPRPVDRPKASTKAKPKLEFEKLDPEGTSEFENEIAEVDPIWTRWAEWSSDLIRIGAVALGTLFLAWLMSGSLTRSFFLVMIGGAAMVVLSYPLLITLERPVRITPEQAVTDFYAAASHHFPHYRRMWLLLSSRAREAGEFDTFEDFRNRWQGQLERWRQAKGAGKFTPLKFEVEGFQATKSTGKETSKADYTVAVYLRDRESEGPIESFRMIHGLIKGPDKMWYLNRGVLEQRSR